MDRVESSSGRFSARWLVAAAGAASLALGIGLSPAVLIRLGPLRQSLQSSIDSVRTVAEWEVALARLALASLGGVTVLGAVFWSQLRVAGPVQRVWEHTPAQPRPAWAVSSARGWPLLTLTLLAALGLVFSLAYPHLPPRFAAGIGSEDGLIEVASGLAFLLAAGLSARVAWGPAPAMRRWVHAGLALGFLLCCGEEISWGQRLLGFETPDTLRGLNVQDEANLHNLGGYAADHLFIALVAGYGVLLPLLAARFEFVHRAVDLLGLPVASLSLAAGFALTSSVHDWTVYRVLPRGESWFRTSELRELLSACGLAWLMLETWWLVSKPHAEAAPG